MDTFEIIFTLVWVAVALYVGIFATFFTSKFTQGNARNFQRLYDKTGFPLFRLQARATLKGSNVLIARIIGVIFLVLGVYRLVGLFKLL